VDPERRRRTAGQLLAAIDAIPVGVDGRGDYDVRDLVATMKLESALIGQCTDAIERGRAVENALDGALVVLNDGWRHLTLAELRGDEAEEFYRLFTDPAVADK